MSTEERIQAVRARLRYNDEHYPSNVQALARATARRDEGISYNRLRNLLYSSHLKRVVASEEELQALEAAVGLKGGEG